MSFLTNANPNNENTLDAFGYLRKLAAELSDYDLARARVSKVYTDAIEELPERHTLSEALPLKLYDQKDAPICVPCAIALAMSVSNYLENGLLNEFNPWWLYSFRKYNWIEGSLPVDIFNVSRKIGGVPWSDFSEERDFSRDRDALYKFEDIASNFRIKSYAMCENTDDVKRALYHNKPVYGTFEIYNSTSYPWRRRGNESRKGLHAMLIYGYDGDTFLIANSWGNDFGTDGCTVMDAFEFGAIREMLSITDAESMKRAGYDYG